MKHNLNFPGHAAMLMLLLSLSGCGQKGDLYLPEIPPAPDLLAADSKTNQVVSGPESADKRDIENAKGKDNKLK